VGCRKKKKERVFFFLFSNLEEVLVDIILTINKLISPISLLIVCLESNDLIILSKFYLEIIFNFCRRGPGSQILFGNNFFYFVGGVRDLKVCVERDRRRGPKR